MNSASNTSPNLASQNAGGFTLVELMVTITLLSILLMVSAPSFFEWIRNNQIRSAAESLQNGLRTAKGWAINLNRQVVFTTTNAAPGANPAAAVGGLNWAIQYVPLAAGEDLSIRPLFLEGGTFASGISGITITEASGKATICFNALGRIVANTTPNPGGSPSLPACTTGNVTYDISRTGAVAGKDRPLRVTVSIAGQIRMCDPARAISSTSPDGC